MPKSDLRRSLDLALQAENMLQINLAVISSILKVEKAIADDLVVLIAEFWNQDIAQLGQLQLMIGGLIEEIRIFGESGPEKQLAFVEDGHEEDLYDDDNGMVSEN